MSETAAPDLRAALAAAVGSESAPAQIDSCPGCCSSHGGITNSCAGNGHVVCRDGSVSPSCLCSSCGTSPPPPPTCTGGTYWNGFACVCHSGQVLIGGVCTTPPPTCTGGTHWDGYACVCSSGQVLVGGVCTTPTTTCNGGTHWDGHACVCPAGEVLIVGVCSTPTPTCTGGTVWNGTACACPAGQELVSGRCETVSNLASSGGMSGSWFDPDQSGHGFLIEVLKGSNLAQAMWFAFDNHGNQAWITALGEISNDTIVMPALIVYGGRFPPHFDVHAIEQQEWGTLTFRFIDCDHATVTWSTTHPDFTPTGTMNLVRLTQIEGTTCP